jgi:fibronectin type III domain protein
VQQQQLKLKTEKSELERVLAWKNQPAVHLRQAVQVLSSAHEWHQGALTVMSDGIQVTDGTHSERWHFSEINRMDLGSGLDNYPVTVHFDRRIGEREYVQFGVGPSSGPFPRSSDREQHRQLLNRLRVVYEAWRHSGTGQQQVVANDRLENVRMALETDRSVSVASSSGRRDPIVFQISEVRIVDITARSATVTWDTSQLGDGQVEYCQSFMRCGTNTRTTSEVTITHEVDLSGLSPNQTYFVWVNSRDAEGRLHTEGYFLFSTKPNH